VIVKVIKDYQKKGLIQVIDSTAERENMAKEEGIVVAMGPEMFYDGCNETRDSVKIGSTVIFARYAGKQLIPDDGEGNELRVMQDLDIHCVVEND